MSHTKGWGRENGTEQDLEIPEIPELSGFLRGEDRTKLHGVTGRQFQCD